MERLPLALPQYRRRDTAVRQCRFSADLLRQRVLPAQTGESRKVAIGRAQ
jgi:hypothetical protein